MPYIKHRELIQPHLEEALKYISYCGELTFALSFLAKHYTESLSRAKGRKNPSYMDWNEAIGSLECTKLEMYRSQIGPYEQRKLNENGDV